MREPRVVVVVVGQLQYSLLALDPSFESKRGREKEKV
jgi:hypothetical protein